MSFSAYFFSILGDCFIYLFIKIGASVVFAIYKVSVLNHFRRRKEEAEITGNEFTLGRRNLGQMNTTMGAASSCNGSRMHGLA
jgi:Na+/proline symporter